MIDLVTLERAKEHLRVTGSESDDDILGKISQASDFVLNYLKIADLVADSSPPTSPAVTDIWPPYGIVPGEVEAATLLVLGELYEKREAADADVLSQAVRDLLHRRRDPALA